MTEAEAKPKQTEPRRVSAERSKVVAQALARLVRDTRLSHGAVRLFMCLYLHWNKATGICFPNHLTIRDEIGCTLNVIKKWVTELQSAGWVTVVEEKWHKGVRHVYTLLNGQGELLLKPITTVVTENHNDSHYGKPSPVVTENIPEVVTENRNTTVSIGTVSNEHKKKVPKKFQEPSLEEVKSFAASLNDGTTDAQAKRFFFTQEGKGWKRVVNWQATFRAWLLAPWNGNDGGKRNGLPPLWKQIEILEHAIDTHPANSEWVGYDRAKVTDEDRRNLKAKRAQLAELEKEAV